MFWIVCLDSKQEFYLKFIKINIHWVPKIIKFSFFSLIILDLSLSDSTWLKFCFKIKLVKNH